MKAIETTALNTVICPEPTREEIAMCAFLTWEKNGRQPGRDFDYWLEADA